MNRKSTKMICKACGGTGIDYDFRKSYGVVFMTIPDCPKCRGTGTYTYMSTYRFFDIVATATISSLLAWLAAIFVIGAVLS